MSAPFDFGVQEIFVAETEILDYQCEIAHRLVETSNRQELFHIQ